MSGSVEQTSQLFLLLEGRELHINNKIFRL